MDNNTNNKTLDFHINHKVFSVNIGKDTNNEIRDGILKFLDLEKNLNTQDLLLALIKKTHELVELENSLDKLSLELEDIKQ